MSALFKETKGVKGQHAAFDRSPEKLYVYLSAAARCKYGRSTSVLEKIASGSDVSLSGTRKAQPVSVVGSEKFWEHLRRGRDGCRCVTSGDDDDDEVIQQARL